jgi:hypothetical protein
MNPTDEPGALPRPSVNYEHYWYNYGHSSAWFSRKQIIQHVTVDTPSRDQH